MSLSNVTAWWPTVCLITRWSMLPPETADKTTSKVLWAHGCEIHLLATWRRRRPAFPRPACSLDGAKSSGAVTGKTGGLFLNASARDQMLPVRAVEGAGRQRFCGGIQRWMEKSAQLLSCPAVAAAAAGVFFRIFCLWQNELDFTSSANMYSAALLLMLAVRIYADSMEGPTGKRRKKKCLPVWIWRGAQRAPVNLLVAVLKLIVRV